MGFPTRLKLAGEPTDRNTKHQLFLDHIESIPRNLHLLSAVTQNKQGRYYLLRAMTDRQALDVSHDAPLTSLDHPLLRLYA
jgi:hypothetical protein